jgi:hypothetical protein
MVQHNAATDKGTKHMTSLATRFAHNRRMTQRNAPMTDHELMAAAPSVFATTAHESRSARYAMIPTIEAVNGLRKEGFQPFFAAQAISRIEGKTEFTKHMLRLRHESQIARAEANEIILINSHDATSSWQMLAGCFRFVCCNGLVCGSEVADIRVKHSGNAQAEVIQGAYEVLNAFERIEEAKDSFKTRVLTAGEQNAYASAAIAYRFDVEDVEQAPVSVDAVLAPRRYEDRGNTLWETFNRTQENLVGGGLRTERRDANNNRRRGHTRPIAGIDGNVALNRALWVLAEQLRKA